jgi:outer membrane receptor protein involved in Fe transport
MSCNRLFATWGTFLILGALKLLPSAAADDASASAQTPALQEIIVTAERREEKVDKVPISITVFSQKTMDDLGIKNVADLATVVPGLGITPPFATSQDDAEIVMRGIYSGYLMTPTTQLYIDETPIAIRELGASLSKSPWPNIFDLDRVEVLRGPQGTLFGASAMAGAIRFITPQPALYGSSGFLKADLGFTEHGDPSYEIGAALGSAVVPGTVGLRVSAWYQSVGGFIDQVDPFTGQVLKKNANSGNVAVTRAALAIAPSENLTITPAIFAQRFHDENGNGYWVTGLANPPANKHAWGSIAQPMTDNLQVASLSVKYNFGRVSFVSDTSYLHRTSEAVEDITHYLQSLFSGMPFVPGLESFSAWADNRSSTNAWQQEFRLSPQDPSSRVAWVAGAFFREARQGLQQLQSPDLTPLTSALFSGSAACPPTPCTSDDFFGVPNVVYNGQVLNFYDQYYTTDQSRAVFGDLTVNLLKRLRLDVGVRYEHLVVKDQTQYLAGPLNFGPPINATLPNSTDNPVTPRASLTYQFTDDDMVYVSAAKGFRPGGGNNANANIPACQSSFEAFGFTSAPPTFASDSLWSYEIGTKDRFFDRRLSVEGSAYFIRWDDTQSVLFLPGCLNAIVVNQGTVISRGFDLQAEALLSADLKVSAQVGYTDAYYPYVAYGGPAGPGGSPPPILNSAGQKVPQVVPWTAGAIAEYSHDISSILSDARSYLRLDYRWSGAMPSLNPLVAGYDPTVGPYQNPEYGVLNVRLGITRGGLDFSAYANNVTNADPRLGYNHNFNSPKDNLFYASALRPRTLGATVWYHF